MRLYDIHKHNDIVCLFNAVAVYTMIIVHYTFLYGNSARVRTLYKKSYLARQSLDKNWTEDLRWTASASVCCISDSECIAGIYVSTTNQWSASLNQAKFRTKISERATILKQENDSHVYTHD